jgi:hypothetical protein
VIKRTHREADDWVSLTGLGLMLCAAWFGVVFWWVLNL